MAGVRVLGWRLVRRGYEQPVGTCRQGESMMRALCEILIAASADRERHGARKIRRKLPCGDPPAETPLLAYKYVPLTITSRYLPRYEYSFPPAAPLLSPPPSTVESKQVPNVPTSAPSTH